MSDKDTENKSGGKTLSLKSGGAGGAGAGRRAGGGSRPSKVVVETKRKRISVPTDGKPTAKRPAAGARGGKLTVKPSADAQAAAPKKAPAKPAPKKAAPSADKGRQLRTLTEEEKVARAKALEAAKVADAERKIKEAEDAKRREAEAAARAVEEAKEAARQAEEDKKREVEEAKRAKEAETRAKAEEEAAKKLEAEERAAREAKQQAEDKPGARKEKDAPKGPAKGVRGRDDAQDEAEDDGYDRRIAPPSTLRVKQSRGNQNQPKGNQPVSADRRRTGKLTINQALDEEGGERARSLASIKRRREREKRQLEKLRERGDKVVREVTIPEAITVQELASRMAERGAAVVKTLIDLGVMVTINQTIDADTAQLVVEEFGHKWKRVSESDVEEGIGSVNHEDDEANLLPRAPVVTVMGHVDHGKTSLLDAFRKTNVVAGEAGGITQHIGAYQVTSPSGHPITFLDTPGHAAFTAMRARGAKVTDIVIIVVAANDSVMPQTIEAINHAKAAGVPIIVAINKCDLPEANADKTKQDLLQHEIYVEDLGGDIQSVEVSAKTGLGLDTLEEAIALQAELLELKANPNREAAGAVVESQLDKGRGSVATVLVQNGTLRVGDIFVAGAEWGRVRALVNDQGKQVKEAGPSVPVEVLGLQGTPSAGDDVVVVDSENRAREISEFRQRKQRELEAAKGGSAASFEQMFAKLQSKEIAEVPLVIKADVQGSAEAIEGALDKLGTEEVQARILHSGVGGITESDITLAAASQAVVIGFNVRANAQARNAAKAEGIEIRYYSVIYDLVDDVKAAMSGMLAPEISEEFVGRAEIRDTFSVSKIGKIAGCLVTEGAAKAASKVRLLRDDVVVHEGKLASLRRFKDEVKEVAAGTECGMQIENYQDIKVGDVIELFEVKEIERSL